MQDTETTAPVEATPAATVGQQVVITAGWVGHDDRIVGMQGTLTLIDTADLKHNLATGTLDECPYAVRLPDGEIVAVPDVRPVDNQATDERLELESLRRMRTQVAAYAEHGEMPDDVRRELRKLMHN